VSGLLDSFRTPDLGRQLPRTGTTGPAGMGEIFSAARQSYEALDRSDTRDLYAQRLGRSVTDALAARGRTSIATGYGRRIAISPRNLARDRAAVAARIWQEVAAERARDPEFLKDMPDAETFERAIIEARGKDLQSARAVLQEGQGAGSVLAELGGGVAASLQDPLTQITLGLTLPLGGPIAGSAARRIALGAVREAALNAAASAPALALKARNAEELGEDYGWREGLSELGLQALIGGVFGAGAEGLSVGLDRALRGPRTEGFVSTDGLDLSTEEGSAAFRERVFKATGTDARKRGAADLGPRQLAQALRALPDKTGVPLRQSEEDAARVLEQQADDLESSPFAPSAEGDAAHLANLAEAVEAVGDGRVPVGTVASTEGAVVRPLPTSAGGLQQVSALELRTDPETFQYKGGGDAEGVTERLRGVTEWNPDAANVIMVWERGDGVRFVADGHQRSGLARRLIAEGRYPDIKLLARVYREADGVTAEQAMLRAAGANILNDSGTPLDAAKIIRRLGVDSAYLAGLNLQASFGRQALGLSRLSDDALGLVINGEERTAVAGAVVGRAAADSPELHVQLIGALERADLRNVQQMELMVRDMLSAPRTREVQTDMFGELTVTRALFAERAQVLDRALKAIRDARRALTSAADNAGTLEAAGSQVDRAKAADVAAENAVLADAIERLSRTRDNPVTEALSRAAARVAEGVNPNEAARAFVADLRAQPGLIDELKRGGDGGRGASGDGGPERRPGGDDAAPDRAADGETGAESGEPISDGATGSLFGDSGDDLAPTTADGEAAAGGGADAPALDRGPEVDPAVAARNRQMGQMAADSPLRPGDRAEQADVDGTPLFDAARSPDMFGGDGRPALPAAGAAVSDAASGKAIAEFDDPLGAGAQAQTETLWHDLKRDMEAGVADALDDPDLRAEVERLDAEAAALDALKGCL
jgi:hypothetical protein